MTDSLLGTVAATTETAPVTAGTETTPVVTDPVVEQPGTTKVDEPVLDAEGKPVVAEKAKEGAPEKYADFKPPEGVKAPAGELMTEFSSLAKELGMSQDSAQAAFALVAKLAEKGGASQATRDAARAETTRLATIEGYETATKADPEFGGDKLAENLAIAKAAMHATATPALVKLLNDTGLGSNAEVIRHFLKVAPAFTEAKFVPGGSKPKTENDAAKVLYPNQK